MSLVDEPQLDGLHDLEDSDSDAAIDDIPPNPNYNESTSLSSGVSESTSPCKIHLTSHGHRFGPFAPPTRADSDSPPKILQYDIRALPNPPKNVRTQQTGLHKALREWFFSRPEAVAKLEEVSTAIDRTIEEVQNTTGGAQCAEIHVVVFCEMGKHRSVAFVEELSRRAFYIETESGRERCPVVVQHRDIARGKHDPRSRRQRIDRSDS
ncbi:hypothetical protein B0H13DRAFT_241191 [Mycena leptocephala]|nr:hypothetical protein B0H13DRAFT_241191 [Mycena leptocephala]